MLSATALYLFLLGLACGTVILAVSSYRFVSPAWLKWLLIISALLMIGRYITLALFLNPNAPNRFWMLRHLYFAHSIGLTFPSVVAVDQILRHPAMTPAKLMRWYSPFMVVYLTVMLFGRMGLQPDTLYGWAPHLEGAWRLLISITDAIFLIGFLVICFVLVRKIQLKPMRRALLCLSIGQLYLAIGLSLLVSNRAHFGPFLFSEIAMLLVLWYAYDTSAILQRTGS